jgi:hypothetical protein
MRRSVMRVFASAAVVVALCSTLSACDNNTYVSPISIRLVGATIEVAVCQPIDAKAVRFTESFSRKGQPYDSPMTFFSALGSSSLSRGDVIMAGAPIPGMKIDEYSKPALHRDDIIEVYVDGQNGANDMHTLFGPLNKYPVSAKSWLWTDGRSGKATCPPGE